MKALLIKELNSYFSSPIAYLAIAVYLVVNGLYLWVFDSDFNMLHAGFADLNAYFYLAPWIFVFLIPAISMRSFSEEYSSGTLELLKTKPISDWEIVIAKFLGISLLMLLVLLPTATYYYTIYQLGDPIGNIDSGTTLGSYIGLVFLICSFSAIGLFASTLSKNQIVSFVIGVAISFLLFYGFEAIGNLNGVESYETKLKGLGMIAHFNSIGRGVLDTRDLIYFVSLTALFLGLTKFSIKT